MHSCLKPFVIGKGSQSLVQKLQFSLKTYVGHYLRILTQDLLSYSKMMQQTMVAVQQGDGL